MRVLIAVASRHGATAELAEWIGAALRETLADAAGSWAVDVRAAAEVRDVDWYDAVVIGSAVYLGRWLDDALRLVDRAAPALAARPVWLFSSGPIGDPPKPAELPTVTVVVATRIGARGHRTFPGRVAPSELGRLERLAVRAVKAPAGDYRDRAAARAWAAEIAAELLDLERSSRGRPTAGLDGTSGPGDAGAPAQRSR